MTSSRPPSAGSGTGAQRRAFKTFVSHRYQSPVVNLFFRYWTYPSAADVAAAIVTAFEEDRRRAR